MKLKFGSVPAVNVRLKRSERNNASFTPRLVQPDRVEVNKRIVLLDVEMRVAKVTRFRHVLLISFPGAATGFNEIGQAGRVDETIVAIGINAESITANESNIVRQARMRDRVILGQQRIFAREFVVIGHQVVANDTAKLLVLEHDNDNMLEIWNERLLGGSR